MVDQRTEPSAITLRLRVVLEPATDELAPEGGWGAIWIEGDVDATRGLYFSDQKYAPAADAARVVARRDAPRALAAGVAALAAYLRGASDFDLPPLALAGTAFQRRVWDELLAIPFGETTTYGRIASRIGRPAASRAVGAAVGRNPISLLVPCHRVLGSTSALTGFAGGLARKRALLALEQSVLNGRPSRDARRGAPDAVAALRP